VGDDDGWRLAPSEWFIRLHLHALDGFVRRLYPSVVAERVVHEVFERAERRPPSGHEREVRLWLFSEARALIRRRNRPSWAEHNAFVVRSGLREQGRTMTDWHAWNDLQRLVACLERLTPAEQEVIRLTSLYEDLGPHEVAVVLRVSPLAASALVERATAALRAAYEDGESAAHIDGWER
jgi:DNA-directed RNA polymerase specialized sigma24 family protein